MEQFNLATTHKQNKPARLTSPLLLALLLAAAVVFRMAGCVGPAEAEDQKEITETDKISKTTPPINVKVQPAKLTSLTENVVMSGNTVANVNVTYAAETPGRVEYLGADLGQKVKKGQVLARIDYASLKAQLNQAKAMYELSAKTYDRLKSLADDKLVSQQKLDEALANMQQSKASLEITEVNLNKSIIRATVNGRIARKFTEVGSYVGPGSPVFQVVDTQYIIIEANLAERNLSLVKKDSLVEVIIPALDKNIQTKVETILPVSHDASKTFTMRVKVENKDSDILVGMSARLKIAAKVHQNVIVTSHDSVIEGEDERSVFVLNNGQAEKRIVTLGAFSGDSVILKDGLKAGDQIITVGHRSLTDGQTVKLIN